MAWSNPPAGVLIYNGFWFPELITTRGSITPVYDTTGRFVKYTRLRLRVECMIYPGCDDRPGTELFPLSGSLYQPFFPATPNSDVPNTSQNTVDAGFEQLRKALSEPGMALAYYDKGIGADYKVSGTPGLLTHLDVNFGPKPSIVAWEPIAGNKALRLVWEVETAIADCTGGVHAGGADAGKIAEMAWQDSYEIDAAGLTVRTIAGWLECVGVRQGSRVLYSADRHRANLKFFPNAGWQRTSQTYTVSPDNRRLEWTIVDTEHPSDNALPRGTVDCDISYSVSSEGKSKILLGNQWRCALSGRISVAKDKPRWMAWVAFLQVVKSKLGPAYANSGISAAPETDGAAGGSQYPVNSKKQLVLLRSLSITEEVFGRGMSFSLDWTLFTELGSLFTASGLWAPIETDWYSYYSSMALSGKAWKPRGTSDAGAWDAAYPKAVISLCDLQSATTQGNSTLYRPSTTNESLFETRKPSPEESWISFDTEVELLEDTGRVSHYPLGGDALNTSQTFTRSTTGSGLAGSPSASAPGQRAIVQTRRRPYYRVRFTGTAKRLGHAVPVPRLVSFGGRKCTIVGTTHFTQIQIAKAPKCFLYSAVWSATYELDGPPNGELVVTKPNPKEFPQ